MHERDNGAARAETPLATPQRRTRPTPWRELINAMHTIDDELSAVLTLARVPRPVRNSLLRLREECTLPVLQRATRDKSAPRKHRASHLTPLTAVQLQDYFTLTRKGGYTMEEALAKVLEPGPEARP